MSSSAALAPSSRAAVLLAFSLVAWFSGHVLAAGHPHYADALAKSLLFFQGQRSGRLPPDQAVKWRSNSAMSDGSAVNVDLTGGYYDGGNNVKFNFPMAFTATMLSWSIIEYGGRMEGRVHEARAAVRWATDYLLKAATTTPGKLYVGVGDADADHRCWERPEDMDTPRSVYAVSASAPGSDVAGETAAALAAASVVFRAADRAYSRRLVAAARDVMAFAWRHQGRFSDHVGGGVGNYYPSYSGYKDELLWGSAWLLWATKNSSYLDDLVSLGANAGVDVFSWDNKLAGARVLLSRRALLDGDKRLERFTRQAEEFICLVLPNSSSPSSTTAYTCTGRATSTCSTWPRPASSSPPTPSTWPPPAAPSPARIASPSPSPTRP